MRSNCGFLSKCLHRKNTVSLSWLYSIVRNRICFNLVNTCFCKSARKTLATISFTKVCHKMGKNSVWEKYEKYHAYNMIRGLIINFVLVHNQENWIYSLTRFYSDLCGAVDPILEIVSLPLMRVLSKIAIIWD